MVDSNAKSCGVIIGPKLQNTTQLILLGNETFKNLKPP